MLRAMFTTLTLAVAIGTASAATVEGAGGKACGGLIGLTCGADEWCDYPEDTVCGHADQLGACQPRPEMCAQIYQPVCGCDGNAYGNACEAAAQGVDVAHEGACQSPK